MGSRNHEPSMHSQLGQAAANDSTSVNDLCRDPMVRMTVAALMMTMMKVLLIVMLVVMMIVTMIRMATDAIELCRPLRIDPASKRPDCDGPGHEAGRTREGGRSGTGLPRKQFQASSRHRALTV